MKEEIFEYYNVADEFIEELYFLQVELLKLQKYVSDKKLRLALLFEGRDTAGKGSGIARFTQFMNPQSYNVVALGKPTKREKGQWYFQRYIKKLPNAGEMTFFDRSWYNRAVVEPVMGFCKPAQYDLFMKQVLLFEQMLIEDGVILVKFWFSISSDEQRRRIQKRLDSPLEQWKVSPVDLAANQKWDDFSKYKRAMFERTSTDQSPWLVVKGSRREQRRIESMRHVLSLLDYTDKSPKLLAPTVGSVIKWDPVSHGDDFED